MIKSQVGLLNKFKGSLIGALIGDCYGAFFEGSSCVRVEDVIDFIGRSIEKPGTIIIIVAISDVFIFLFIINLDAIKSLEAS